MLTFLNFTLELSVNKRKSVANFKVKFQDPTEYDISLFNKQYRRFIKNKICHVLTWIKIKSNSFTTFL